MKAQRLIYTFVSYAYYADYSWGHGVPVEGVERTAGIAHKHGIPVTWIVNSGSIKVLGERIRKWHDIYGDDVILRWEMKGDEARESADEARKSLADAWQSLKEAFPWAETKIAARGKITTEMIQILEEMNFKGMWGYCWEQFWWDGITHKGIPWGSWYISNSNSKAPHPGKGKIVACEWTARDLNQAYHTGSPCIFSSDPDDVYRAGLCTGDNIEYWKKLFEDYLQNTENNEYVYFHQQQESHEMEATEAFTVWPLSQIKESEKMLDSFFRYIRQYDITITTLPKAIELYHEKNQITAPCYMLTNDTLIRPEINEYTMTLGGVGLGPWPETFFYYDSQCQLAFIKGECGPKMLRNYIGKSTSEGDFKTDIPPVFIDKYHKSENIIEIEFQIGNWKPVPFGLVYWDDLTGFEVKSFHGALETKIIQDKLVFLRFNHTGEKTKIHLILEKKEK